MAAASQGVKVETSGKNVLIGTGIFVAIVTLIGVYFYNQGKKKGSRIELPDNGSGIPSGWSATADVVALRGAMQGPGTDEEAIFTHLNGKSRDQLVAIYNEYKHKYDRDLLDDFRSELSGAELDTALNYFAGII